MGLISGEGTLENHDTTPRSLECGLTCYRVNPSNKVTLFGPSPVALVASIIIPAALAYAAFLMFHQGLMMSGKSYSDASEQAGCCALVVYLVLLLICFLPAVVDPCVKDNSKTHSPVQTA